MKTKLSTKEIRSTIETAVMESLLKMNGPETSRKIEGAVKKASKLVAEKVKIEWKKKLKKTGKAIKKADKALKASVKNGKAKKDKLKGDLIEAR